MSVLSALRVSRAPVAAFAVVGTFWGSFAAQVPVIKAQVGADDAMFGLLLLGSSLGLLTTMVLAPAFDAKFGHRAMPLSCVLFAGVALAPGGVTVPWMFFCVMMLAGMMSGLTDVTMNARVSELETATGRPLMNANHGIFSVAYAISALATGMAREAGFEPQQVFAGVAVVLLILAYLAQMSAIEAPESDESDGFPVGIVVLCGGVVMIAFMCEAIVEQWSALHIERTLNGGPAEGALGPATLGLTMALGRFGGQAVAERLRDVTVIFWATLLAALGAFIASVAVTPVLAYLGFGLLGLGVSVIGPLGLAIVGRLVHPRERTKAISRAAIIGFIGFSLAPALIGMTSHWYGLRVAFFGTGLFVLFILPLIFSLTRRGA